MSSGSVAILTNRKDYAADVVVNELQSAGIAVNRINADDVILGPTSTWRPDNDDAVGSVWWRQFEIAPPSDDLAPVEIDELLIVRAQWRAWIATFAGTNTRWVNDLWAARRAENKIEQLRVAKQLGFNIPETVVTNSKDTAINTLDADFVIKALVGAYYEFSNEGFVYTHSIDDSSATALTASDWHSQPLIAQERLTGRDVRVICFDNQCFGAATTSEVLDWRTSDVKVNWTEWSISNELRALCFAYLNAFGLRYAAFDFMDVDGTPFFLEANQAGEWHFLDRELDLGIAMRFAQMLSTLAR